MQNYSHILTYLLTLLAIAIFLAVAIPKILFPFEAQWLEGSMIQEIHWLQSGHLLYCLPSIYHVPSVYQPLYFFCNAICTSVTGLTFVSARYLSVISTALLLVLIFIVVRKETGKSFYGIAAIGVYLASYGKTEFCFVAARIDPLLTFLIVLGVCLLYYARTTNFLLLASLILTLSFFTKQSAIVFIPSLIIYLWIFRSRKAGVLFSISFIVFLVIGIMAMNIYSQGWYTFYTFDILRSMGGLVRWKYAIDGLFSYIILRCWLITFLLLFFPIRSFIIQKNKKEENAALFFGLFFATGIIAGFLGILNSGGGHNVLLQAAAGGAIFLPIVISDLQKSGRYSVVTALLLPLQLIMLISNPWNDDRNIARNEDCVNYSKFYRYISSLPGEIWIPFHSYTERFTGKNEYTGFDELQGALLPGDSRSQVLRDQLDTALLNKHWAYILSDIKYGYPYYKLSDSIINLNKVHFSDDPLLYIYTPN